MSGVFYSLGRQAAPALLKAKWMLHAMTGNKQDIVQSEYALGCHLSDIYQRKVGLAHSEAIDKELVGIGRQLAGRLRNKQLKFHFRCDASADPNALALPGGFIYISKPLYELCAGRDNIGFILAHEMGHVVRGHASKRFLTSIAANAVSKTGIRGGPAKRALRDMLVKVMERGYNQSQEFEADDFALHLLRAAKMDTSAAARVLQKIGDAKPADGGILSEYFSTHPSIGDRIARIRQKEPGK